MLKRIIFLLTLVLSLWIFYMKGIVPVVPISWLKQKQEFLVYLLETKVRTLDPAQADDLASARVLANIYEGLVRLRGGTEVEPCLATRWEVSRNGRRWTFYLRPNVTFHDGTPFNAAAVKFNVERLLNQQNRYTYAAFTYGMVQSVEVIDSLTIQFNLKYPYAPFLYNLAMPVAAPMVSPRAVQQYKEEFWKHPAGTGPFIFEQWKENNNEITLVTNSRYWGVKPSIPGVIFRTVPDPNMRIKLLLSRSAQISEGIPTQGLAVLKNKEFRVINTPGLDISYLGFYTNKGPFRDAALRRVARQACNPQELAERLFPGQTITARGPLPPGTLGYEQTFEPLPPEPEKARRELIAADYTPGLQIILLAYASTRPYNPAGGERLARALAEQLERAGFSCSIRVYPWDEFKKALFRQEGDAFIYGWTSDNGDPDNFLYTLFSSEQIACGLNTTRYRNPQVDTLLITAQQTTDSSLRAQIYRDVLQHIREDAPMVFLHHSLHTLVMADNVQGVIMRPQGIPYLGNVQIR
ncbi:ABC transporter substrate-binding protein [Desulfofundulus thermosubterraneus]|uniref:Peptide/nickel transport system substrate-binding protein n=1 Tax=Desulfofundulus thermosubterraneus DSM 16057 TaxID=1121432 RepID=A0A1M6L414_9FIRM|nr:ABC transporter substrate-binding protein [Desulfofundulus thermosubterraneus]SHJ65940.1 peptide/nickel transport system substrate-binding protein [Desulfofundulus thermosubterraneus DSM 16057]